MQWLYKYPQAAFPYARARRGEPPARPRRAGVRAARHRRLRRATATSTSFVEYAKADARGHPDPDHGRPTAGRTPRRSTCCRRSGSATPGRGATDAAAPDAAAAPTAPDGAIVALDEPMLRHALARLRQGAPELLFTENETQHRAALRRAERAAVRQGRHQRLRRERAQRTRSTRRAAARRPRRTTGCDGPGGRRVACALRLTRPAPDGRATVRRRLRRRSSPTASREADEFYATSSPPAL